MNQLSIYSTSDLPLAATLSLSFSIKRLNRENPDRIFFEFENTSKLQGCINAYMEGVLKVEPQQFFTQLRFLKAKIYAHGGNYER